MTLIPASRLFKGSMSATDLLLNCQYGFSNLVTLPQQPIKSPYHLRFGSGYHKTQEIHLESRGRKRPNFPLLAKKYDVEEKRLKHFYERGREFIDAFLKEHGLTDEEFIVEKKIAYDPYADTARYLLSKKERDYSERKPNEFPGTGDLVVLPRDRPDEFFILDWKTGNTHYKAEVNGQLASLGLGMSRIVNRPTAHVSIVRIDDDFIEPYDATLTAKSLNLHRDKLKQAMAQARSANPHMRVGDHCYEQYCKAIEVCPAHAGPESLGDEMHALEDRSRLGVLYDRFKGQEKMLEAIGNRFKREIEMNGPFQRTNGKWATLKEQTKEVLSKASARRALGAVDAEELFEQLRANGAIEETTSMKIDYVTEASAKK